MEFWFTQEQVKSKPPTAEQIQGGKREVSRHYRMLWGATALSFIASGFTAYFGSPFCIMMVALTFFGGLTACTIDPLHNFKEIDTGSDCDRMYQACEQSAEGRAYRQAVIAQGRRFVNAELQMMVAWNTEQQQAAACKRLYDIAA